VLAACRRIFGSGDCPVLSLTWHDLENLTELHDWSCQKAQSPLFAMPSDAQLKPGVILNGAPRASRAAVIPGNEFPAELRKADSRIQSYSLEF
jgi:hypothetical protein